MNVLRQLLFTRSTTTTIIWRVNRLASEAHVRDLSHPPSTPRVRSCMIQLHLVRDSLVKLAIDRREHQTGVVWNHVLS
jgi:hypothetical protein